MKINGKEFQEPDSFEGFNESLDYAIVPNQGAGEFQEGVFRNREPKIVWTLNAKDAEYIKQLHYSTDIVSLEYGNKKANVIFTSAILKPIFGFSNYYKVEATILPVIT